MIKSSGAAASQNASEKLRQYKEQVLTLWEKEVRGRIPQATSQTQPILIDTLPKFLDNLVEALSPESPRKLATDGCSIAQEHGGERARSTNYSIDALLTEYKILREVIFQLLLSQGELSEPERSTILGSIDEAIMQSALAFTLVLQEIREQFVATLSHDLRGPLSTASANIQMILKYPDKRDQHALYAAKAIDNMKRVDRMITDLLDATQVQAGEMISLEMSECDAVQIVRLACEEMSTVYGNRFVFNCELEKITAWLNKDALVRVIENLGSNAVKYGDDHAAITILLKEIRGRILLTVHNQGPPIPAEERETLFRAFSRTTSARRGKQKGWGLGLALVRGVAEAHGGSIVVDSGAETGTTMGIDILQDARNFSDVRRLG